MLFRSDYANELGVSKIVVEILLNRGICKLSEMKEFLFGLEKPFYDPFLLKDMLKSCNRILQAIDNNDRITVYGDYDVDGISASSLMYLFLKKIGAEVDTYIPQRKSEGYGLNLEALQMLFNKGTKLLITVDCGVSGVYEVNNAPKGQIGRAHVRTPVTFRKLVCRLLIEKKHTT